MEVFKKWENNKISKFAEPVTVDISPFVQGLWETVDNYRINRLKITAKNANSISVYFDKLNLSKNASLYIYNPDGTVITGPITETENILNDKIWGSNVFQGTSIIIEFKSPISEEKFNQVHIQKILYGINPKLQFPNKDSITGPGFGLSSSCNINVICIAGWEQERRAIAQVVDEGGNWCSAALMMNTCNTNRPFILTANHCIFQNGSLINTNNSTFEFLWFSPTCTPTTNTTTLLFNGATIRARWEQSDFALLELNQTIASNANLNFLGWTRSATPPNGSVGIHHPMGDIMKISVENNLASIGNVRTFPNTAWRVVWNQGTVEGGSSGSPLFDLNHRVVGQLFSNTQPTNPPCNQATGGSNYGRFDISWTGGGTNDSRLSNWLDPNNSGILTTNTTNIATLFQSNPTLTISGSPSDDNICSGSSTYSLNGLPANATVCWSISTPSIASIPNPSCNSSVIVTKQGNGFVTLTANAILCDGQTRTINKKIRIGVAVEGYYFINSNYHQPLQRQLFENNSPIWLPANQYFGVTAVVTGVNLTSNTWTREASSYPFNWSASGTTLNFSGNAGTTPYTQRNGIFTLTAQNACGTATQNFLWPVIVQSGSFRVAASPNPVSSSLNVTFSQQTDTEETSKQQGQELKPLRSMKSTGKTIVTLFEFNTSLQVRQWTQNETNNKGYNFNVAGLRKGLYVLQVDRNNQTATTKIIVE